MAISSKTGKRTKKNPEQWADAIYELGYRGGVICCLHQQDLPLSCFFIASKVNKNDATSKLNVIYCIVWNNIIHNRDGRTRMIAGYFNNASCKKNTL